MFFREYADILEFIEVIEEIFKGCAEIIYSENKCKNYLPVKHLIYDSKIV